MANNPTTKWNVESLIFFYHVVCVLSFLVCGDDEYSKGLSSRRRSNVRTTSRPTFESAGGKFSRAYVRRPND